MFYVLDTYLVLDQFRGKRSMPSTNPNIFILFLLYFPKLLEKKDKVDHSTILEIKGLKITWKR